MSQTVDVGTPPAPARDERVAQRSTLGRLLARPETGALAGAIVIFIIFFIVAPPFREPSSLATVLYVSSTYGIPAVAVALLMIGGEFDLSAGVAVTSSALVAAMLSYELSANMWVGIAVALVAALVIGFINGYLVVKTGIPSFLVTLGTFFMLRGLNLAVTKIVTGNVATNDVSDIQGFELGRKVFASTFTIGGVGIRITLLWWILFVIIATWVLLRTHIGNWIFAVGGSAPSSSGVGVGNEFIYIVAAVVGGCLLTGGYGSVIGAAIGALIFGMTNQGIVYAGWNPDWFFFFLGALLLGAILFNNFIRSRAEASR
jgi:simple sugar transport system permease protein